MDAFINGVEKQEAVPGPMTAASSSVQRQRAFNPSARFRSLKVTWLSLRAPKHAEECKKQARRSRIDNHENVPSDSVQIV